MDARRSFRESSTALSSNAITTTTVSSIRTMMRVSVEPYDSVAGAGSSPAAAAVSSHWMSMLGHFANVFKAFIGLNYLSLPYAMHLAGLWAGLVGLAVVALFTQMGCLLLVRCKSTINERQDKLCKPSGARDAGIVHTYGDVAGAIAGIWAQRTVDVLLVLTQFGFCVGYMIFLASTLSHLVDALSVAACVAIFFPAVCALTFIRSVAALRPFSMLANASLLVGFVVVVVLNTRHIAQHGQAHAAGVNWSGLGTFFGLATSSYEGIGCILPIEESLGRGEAHQHNRIRVGLAL